MITIQDLLDKIKWDENLKEEEYTIGYEDRKAGKINFIAFTDIKKTEQGFMTIERAGVDVEIPIHRIKVVKKKGEVVWQR